MGTDRRRIMTTFGVMFASAVTLSCRLGRRTPAPTPSCYVIPPSTSTPTPRAAVHLLQPTPAPSTTGASFVWSQAWTNLREFWHEGLDQLAKSAGDDQRGPELRDALAAQHRIALDRLVVTEGLDTEVAEDLQAAYEGAVYHVWRANSNLTCYAAAPQPDYITESRSDLARQAQVLAEMAERSAVDKATLAQAEAAIEHDIAFLAMSAGDQEAFVESVRKAAAVGEVYPELADLDMKVPESSLAAARILVQLLAAPSVPTQ